MKTTASRLRSLLTLTPTPLTFTPTGPVLTIPEWLMRTEADSLRQPFYYTPFKRCIRSVKWR